MHVGDPDGHGRFGFVDTDGAGKLICHHCGESFDHLATHARYSHGISSAAEYRRLHGLKRSQRLVSQSASKNMAVAYDRHRDAHLEALRESRDPIAANRESLKTHRKREGWSPAARASRAESLRAKRGRDLRPDEIDYLADDIPMEEWCRRARELLKDKTLSRSSMSRSLGLGDGAVYQRLRRYP